MKKRLFIFHPNIKNDGCKKTLELYCDHFVKKFKITLITNTLNTNLLKKINSDVKIINPRNFFFKKNCCIFYFLRFKNTSSTVLSLDGHFLLLFLKLLKQKFKLIVRIANPIIKKNKNFFTTDPGLEIGNLDLMLMRFADLVVLYNKEHSKILLNTFKVKKTLIIRNYFPKIILPQKIIKKKYNISFVGRLVKNKDPVFFLKSCLKLNENFYSKILVIGSGPLLKDLKEISKKHSGKVKFFKFVKDPFKSLHKKIDIFCLTSKYDGTPNVLGEAISYKIPCLSPKNVGCSNELLGNGKYGELYEQNNQKDFLKKLKIIIKKYRNSITKAEKAYKGLEKYNKSSTLSKLEKKLISF